MAVLVLIFMFPSYSFSQSCLSENCITFIEKKIENLPREKVRLARCLAHTIFQEARGEPDLGLLAVGWVVKNRSRDSDFPEDFCEIVAQRNQFAPARFHWMRVSARNKTIPPSLPDISEAYRAKIIAWNLLENPSVDPTHGALYFRARKSKTPPKSGVQIGNHLFTTSR